MFDYIDIYCERLSSDFWAEPINAITNAAFLLAAFFAYVLARKQGQFHLGTPILVTLMVCIGVGSFLFHTFAVGWAKLADVLPIVIYQIAFLICYSRYVIGLNWIKTSGSLALFFASSYGFAQFPYDWLNGSLSYGSALVFVAGFGIWHLFNKKREKFILLAAAGVFIVSLSFRSMDMAVCDALPFGVHFLWHTLNGLVLYLTTRAFILNHNR